LCRKPSAAARALPRDPRDRAAWCDRHRARPQTRDRRPHADDRPPIDTAAPRPAGPERLLTQVNRHRATENSRYTFRLAAAFGRAKNEFAGEPRESMRWPKRAR
jgi:hypothetical protein